MEPLQRSCLVLIDNFTLPLNVSVTPAGDLLVPDAGTGTIYRIDPANPQKTVIGTGFGEVYTAVEDADGRIYVASMDLNAIFRLTPSTPNGCSAAPNGTSCDDGNACTQTDTCQAGSCLGSDPVVCTASDACHSAGTCNTTTGSCGAGQPLACTVSAGSDKSVAEGTALPMAATTSPATIAGATFAWTWGDGSAPSNGQNASHTYADNGDRTATVTLTVGALSSSASAAITISNVAPTITSTPSNMAREAQQYTYTLTFTDPGTADTHTCSAPTKPAGSALVGCQLVWTPDFSQAIGAAVPVRMCVTDDDSGQACQDFAVTVTFLDSDGDTLPDSWEISNFGNITSQDQTADPDGDGMNNLQEFTNVTDPLTYDGPNAPTPASPMCGAEVASLQTTLTVNNAVDPQGTPLIYDYQLFSDSDLTILIAEALPPYVAQGVGATTSWSAPTNLLENTRYFWRARAKDQFTFGPFIAPACSFFVNTVNEAPGIPRINSPTFGAQVNTFTPTLWVDNATDPDQDVLRYKFEVYRDEALTNLAGASDLLAEGTEGTTSWSVRLAAGLMEDRTYYWRARAVDPDNLEGGWSATGQFFVTTTNAPPEAPSIVSPLNGTTVGELRPSLVILNADDSDLDPLVYDWDLARDGQFAPIIDGAQNAPPQGAQNTAFHLTADLVENTRYCWRARADDGQVGSPYNVACFLVSERNDSPTVPTLNNPSDTMGATTTTPVFSWTPSTDPEDEAITYEIEVKTAAGDAVGMVTGVSGTVTSIATELTNGASYSWRARATDRSGASSAFSPENTFTVNAPVGPPVDIQPGSGCGTGGWTGSGGFFVAAVGVLAHLRRRRRTNS